MLNPEGFGLLPITEADPGALAGFDCGKPHLNEFLLNAATSQHRGRFGYTSLVFHRDVQGLVGYFTLANDAIPLSTSEQGEVDAEVVLSAFPAVKLGRLAITSKLQGSGIGAQVISLVIGEIVNDESLSASRLVVVDADNDERVIRFYKSQGFQPSLWAEKNARNHQRKGGNGAVKMWLDILNFPAVVSNTPPTSATIDDDVRGDEAQADEGKGMSA